MGWRSCSSVSFSTSACRRCRWLLLSATYERSAGMDVLPCWVSVRRAAREGRRGGAVDDDVHAGRSAGGRGARERGSQIVGPLDELAVGAQRFHHALVARGHELTAHGPVGAVVLELQLVL